MKYDANRLGNGKKTMTAKQIEQYVDENAGTEYTAGEGISIVDNVISATSSSSDYILYNSINWSDIFKKDSNDAWYVTKDCVIVARDNQNFNYTINLFKGVIYGNAFTILSTNFAQSGTYVNNSTMLMLLYNINFDNASIDVITQTLQINSDGSIGVQSHQTFVKDTSISGYIGNNHIRLFVKD